METSLDPTIFRNAIESMKRILNNGKLTKVSCAVFNSDVETVNEICLRKVNNIEVHSEVKYYTDQLKKNFEKSERFSSLSIRSMYRQRCAEKIESLENLYTNFEARIVNKERPPTETIDYAPETFGAIKDSVYSDHNYTSTSLTEPKQYESYCEIKLKKTKDEVVNTCKESSIAKDINEIVFMTESKSTLQNTKTASSKVKPSANVEKITECINENVFIDQPENTMLENIFGEFTNPIQDETIRSNNPNGSSSVSLTRSSVDEEEFRRITALEAELKQKTKELANQAQEISALIEERKRNNMAYRELKLANKEFKKYQGALSVLQDEIFVKFPQNLTQMLSSHHQLIREEFSELKNEMENLNEVFLAANKDLRQHIEAQEIPTNHLKSELQSLKVTMEDIMKKKDEEVGQMINHLNDLLKANDKCRFCSNQTYEEENRNKKVPTPDKAYVDEDSLEEM